MQVVDIGLPQDAEHELPVELLDTRWVRERLPERPRTANKGTFGRVLVVAGSVAVRRARRVSPPRPAYRAGAGLVTLACTDVVQPTGRAGRCRR